MKNVLLIILCCVNFSTLFAQKDTIYFENGKILSITYGNRIKTYYPNGNIKSDEFLGIVNSNLEACMRGNKRWYKNGNLEFESTIDSIGVFSDRYYYESGHIKQQDISLTKIVDGDTEAYYCYAKYWCENGTKTVETCVYCKAFQPYISYFCNGNIKCKSKYYGGQYYGNYSEYWENGKIAIKGQFQDFSEIPYWLDEIERVGNKIGNWEYYNKNGKLIKTEIYDEYGKLLRLK